MCGIAGLVWKADSGRRVEDFRRAASLMVHRGPDAHGEFLDDRVFLIHYRLAILDLTPAGKQPFRLEQELDSIGVYNGELYNFREIAERNGIDQKTSCDTEVVLKSFSKFGPAILPQYNGIFAFAQYFPQERKLVLVRDRLGVKPLYTLDTPDYFAFASEAKVLYAFMDEMLLDPQVLREYLTFGSSMSMQTLVRGVNKLPAGSYLTLHLGNFSSDAQTYWTVESSLEAPARARNYASAKRQVKSLLAAAVERQCLSDVPIGAYLSGGLDSSMIVALASEREGPALKTFSVEFEGSANSELPLARQVAERYGTEHHEMQISPNDLLGDLEALILQYDEPFADPAALPLHLMATKCAPMAKVILQGDGGDELFAGYGRHLDMSQFRRRLVAFGLLSRFHPNGDARRQFKGRYGALSATPLSARLTRLAGNPRSDLISSVLKGDLKFQVLATNPSRLFESAASSFGQLDPVSQVLFADMVTILPHRFLEKVDKVSMWHSVEARVPLLDNDLVDFLVGLPSRYKIRGGVTKVLLREIASEYLPAEVVQGRKQSFGTPMDSWLKNLLYGFVQGVLHSARARWSDCLDFDRIFALHKEHAEGLANHSAILWRLVVLLVWLNHYGDKVKMPLVTEGAVKHSQVH